MLSCSTQLPSRTCMIYRRLGTGVEWSDPVCSKTIRACSACGPQVRAERLRHPSGVVGLQWSPSGLQQGAPQYEHLQVCPIPCQKTLQHIAPS